MRAVRLALLLKISAVSASALEPRSDFLPRRSQGLVFFECCEPPIKLPGLCGGKLKLLRYFNDAVPDRLQQAKALRYRQSDHISHGDPHHASECIRAQRGTPNLHERRFVQ